MKKLQVKSLLMAALFLMGTLAFYSCSKSDDNTATPPAPGIFVWTTGGATYTADKDSAFISGPFSIVASKDASLASIKSFQIYLSAFTAGAYTLSTSGNQLNYYTTAGLITSQSGTLNITANTGARLSGNFTTTLTGGVAMTGTFTDVPIK